MTEPAATSGSVAGRREAVPLEAARLRSRLVRMLAARLALATVVLGGTAALAFRAPDELPQRTLGVLFGLIAASYAFGGVLAWWIPRSRRLELLAGAQLLWDLLSTTVLVYVTGGASSVYSVLYAVTVVLAALVSGVRGALATAAGAVSLYASVSLALAFEWVEAPWSAPFGALGPGARQLPYALLSNLVGIVLVALFAVALAERLRRAGGVLRQAEAEVRSLARLNDAIVRSTASGLLTADVEGRVRTANPAAEAIFGTPEPRLRDARLSELFDGMPDSPPERAERGETRAHRADGTSFPVGYTRTPLSGAEGELIGTLVAFVDLSEIQALREAAEQAERLAVLGRLAAGLAHEIRNPLGSISGAVQLVAKAGGLEEEDRHLLQIARREVTRLDELVRTMLQVSRPRRPERRPVRLERLAREVLDSARIAPGGDRARLELHVAPDVPEVLADPDQLRQLLWNLVRNAVQASPEGGRVTVRLQPASDGGVLLVVDDEGPGVPETERARLFEAFYSTREHGVGLGLALVRQIVEAHQGRVRVEEAPGGGARFVVELPPGRPSSELLA